MLVVVLVVAAVALLGVYLTWLAGRLDRLAVRVEAARESLEAQLVRRAAAAQRLASRVPSPPAADQVAAAAGAALQAGPQTREAAESALTRALRAALAGPGPGEDVVAEVTAAGVRVQLARQFHNDAVHATRALRGRRVVRLLRLSAARPVPAYFEFDDTLV